MAKRRERGKLGGLLNKTSVEEEKTPSSEDLKKMLEETEGKETKAKIVKSEKVKIGTQVDRELYQQFRDMVKKRGLKLGFVVESMMSKFIEENS